MRILVTLVTVAAFLGSCSTGTETATTVNSVYELGRIIQPQVVGLPGTDPAFVFATVMLDVWCPFFNDMEAGLIAQEDEADRLDVLIEVSRVESGFPVKVYDSYIGAFLAATASDDYELVAGSCEGQQRPSTVPEL